MLKFGPGLKFGRFLLTLVLWANLRLGGLCCMVEDAWSKKAPGGFGVWGAVLQEAPGQKRPLVVLEQKGPLVVLGFGAGASKSPWSNLLEAPGQKGP